MKIQTINRIKEQPKAPNVQLSGYSAGVCKESKQEYSNMDKGHRASSDVTFTSNYDKATKTFKNVGKTFWDKIAQSKGFEKLLGFFEANTSVMQAGVALIVAGLIRPATNLAMANKDDREDAMYAASHAVASGIIGFGVSSLILTPTLDKAYKKVKDKPKKYFAKTPELAEKIKRIYNLEDVGARHLGNSKSYQTVSKAAQMLFDTFILGIPKALLTIALIPPILKYVFGWEKKPKNVAVKADTSYINNFVKSPVFDSFKGGNK